MSKISTNTASVRFVEKPDGSLDVTMDYQGGDDSGPVRMAEHLMADLVDLIDDASKLRISMDWEMGSCKD